MKNESVDVCSRCVNRTVHVISLQFHIFRRGLQSTVWRFNDATNCLFITKYACWSVAGRDFLTCNVASYFVIWLYLIKFQRPCLFWCFVVMLSLFVTNILFLFAHSGIAFFKRFTWLFLPTFLNTFFVPLLVERRWPNILLKHSKLNAYACCHWFMYRRYW